MASLSGRGGFIERLQLIDAGVGAKTIESWLKTERLARAWCRVYAVGHLPTEPCALAFGAMLAAGADSAIAGFSAGAFYGAIWEWPDTPELISPHRKRVRGLVVHHCVTLGSRDVWRFDGLRVTSPARTALDLAPRLSPERLPAVVDHLRLRPRDKLTIGALEDVIKRNPRHPGVPALTRVLVAAGRRPRRSGLEREGWPAFAAAYDLPPYEQNTMVGGHEVDVLVDGLVAVEIDTVETHLLKFESDRRRDAEILARTGIPVIRVTATSSRRSPRAPPPTSSPRWRAGAGRPAVPRSDRPGSAAATERNPEPALRSPSDLPMDSPWRRPSWHPRRPATSGARAVARCPPDHSGV